MNFPNKAGTHSDTDTVLSAELSSAGIKVLCHEFLRGRQKEVKTAIMGELHQWVFDRAWYYWVCTGPGIPVEDAEALHAERGQEVRVGGHCGCPHPREFYGGFGVGVYHVDTQEGLNALAATIRTVAQRSRPRRNNMYTWKPIESAPRDGSPILGRARDQYAVVAWEGLPTEDGYWSLTVCGARATDGEWWPEAWCPIPGLPNTQFRQPAATNNLGGRRP